MHEKVLHMGHVGHWCKCLHQLNFIVVLGTFGSHHKERCCPLRMANVVYFIKFLVRRQNMIDHCGQIRHAQLMIGEVPISVALFLQAIRIETHMTARIEVATRVAQPDIMTKVGQHIGCRTSVLQV